MKPFHVQATARKQDTQPITHHRLPGFAANWNFALLIGSRVVKHQLDLIDSLTATAMRRRLQGKRIWGRAGWQAACT